MGAHFEMVNSANITDEEATTAQLTSPAGKDGGDFQAGMMKDESETAEGIDLAADKYTEIEYCIQATADAVIGDTYEFRLTCPTSYYPVGEDCLLYHAYWDGTATDHSSYGNDGTVTGATFVENGLSFDGTDDDVVTPNGLNGFVGDGLGRINDMTIIAWVKVTAEKTDTRTLLCQLNCTGKLDIIMPYSSTFYWDCGSFTDGRLSVAYDDSWLNAWKMFSVTSTVTPPGYVVGAQEIRVNDVSVASDSNATYFEPGSDAARHIVIGSWTDGSLDWKGIIGELYIFDSLLTTEITNIYNATKSRYGL